MFQHGSLQIGLYPVHERQLILIDDTKTRNDSIELQVNPNHHPIIILKKAKLDPANILKEVACHDGMVVKSNIFRTRNSELNMQRDVVGSYPTERLVQSLKSSCTYV